MSYLAEKNPLEKHPLELFSESLDLDNFRIINFPSLIFFCGGFIPSSEEFNNRKYFSVRHYIRDYLRSHDPEVFKKIILAEEINDWYRGSYYTDLLSFEKDIAELAAIIVLFVESPGSIAELGSFSLIDQVNKKLLVFINYNHYMSDSFIKHGPITYLEEHIGNKVKVHYWALINDGDIYYLDIESIKGEEIEIFNAIDEKVKNVSVEHQFIKNNIGHKMLFICDIIDVIGIIKSKDILILFEKLGITIEKRELKKYLFILEKLRLIKVVPYSSERYYSSLIDKSFIKYAYSERAYLKDRTAWKLIFGKWYSENDDRRARALRQIRVA